MDGNDHGMPWSTRKLLDALEVDVHMRERELIAEIMDAHFKALPIPSNVRNACISLRDAQHKLDASLVVAGRRAIQAHASETGEKERS